jgi:hypothetical protein
MAEEEESIIDETYKAYTDLPFWQQLIAGVTPVSGEAISAYETPMYAKETQKEFEEGDVLGTLGSAAMTGLSGLGAVPGLGMVARGMKGAGKVAGKTFKSLSDEFEETITEIGDIGTEKFSQWRKQWQDENRLPQSQKQKQDPDVEKAAQEFYEGTRSGKSLRNVVKSKLPIEPITEMPEMPSLKKMMGSLNENKLQILGVNTEIADGSRVATRLDIPAYNDYDAWVVTIHEGGKKSGAAKAYGKTAVLDDVEFMSSPSTALDISRGKIYETGKKAGQKQAKSTIARMDGNWKNVEPDEAYKLAEDILSNPDKYPEWSQVGMNPYRGSYFYNKMTGEPLQGAEQLIQVGPLVLAKNVRKPTLSEYKKNFVTKKGKKVFQTGGVIRNPYGDYSPRDI